MTRITRSYVAPNPKEFEYWVDLAADPKGNVIKYYAGGSKWLPLNDDTDNDQSARIAALESGKVDKVEGKELSSNDFTDAYKTKLDGIAAQANKYVLPTATAEIIGGVKVGANISYSNGTISLSKANVTSALGYTPPTADTKVTINNTLTSTSTTEALAAAQGKALKDLIDALTTRVAALETPAA
jgi:Head fiber protein.